MSKILNASLIPRNIKYSIAGMKAAVSIVMIRDEPTSLYHSNVRSGYSPLKGTQNKKV